MKFIISYYEIITRNPDSCIFKEDIYNATSVSEAVDKFREKHQKEKFIIYDIKKEGRK